MEKFIIIGTLIIILTLCFVYSLCRGLGKATDIDDPLDDKFWKDRV